MDDPEAVTERDFKVSSYPPYSPDITHSPKAEN